MGMIFKFDDSDKREDEINARYSRFSDYPFKPRASEQLTEKGKAIFKLVSNTTAAVMQTEYHNNYTANELGDKPSNLKTNNMTSTKMNWAGLIIAALIGFFSAVGENYEVVTNVFSAPTLHVLQLIGFVVSPILAVYNGVQIFKKRNY